MNAINHNSASGIHLKESNRLYGRVSNLPSDVLLELAEWQALYCHHHQTKTTPPSTLGVAVRMIGRLGGFIGRKSDGHPGSTAIWRGLQRLQDITTAWRRWRGA